MFVIEFLKWDTPNGVVFRVFHDVRGFEQAVEKAGPEDVSEKGSIRFLNIELLNSCSYHRIEGIC